MIALAIYNSVERMADESNTICKSKDLIRYLGETRDTFMYADETLPIYFSLADLDGDGVLELVFSCDYDVVWILHYEEGKVYGYHLRPATVITMVGVFRTDDDLSPTGYARITAFKEDGCQKR